MKNFILSNVNKLRADISYPTSDGVMLKCDDNSLYVGNETSCVLTGFASNGAFGVAGKLNVSENIEVVSITKSSDFIDLGAEDGDSSDIFTLFRETPTTEQFVIANITIKGLTEGTGTLTFGPSLDNEKVELNHAVNNEPSSEYVNDAVFEINVISSSSSPDSPKSSINTLSSLKVNDTEIINDLTITLTDAVEASISARPTDSKATVTGDGRVTLSTGDNTFNIVVTAEDGSKKTYTITIVNNKTGLDSTNTLSVLTVDNATLIPTFVPTTTNYGATVKNAISSVTITATPTKTSATVTGDVGQKQLVVGSNIFNIVVTAQSGSKKTYKINIEREAVIDGSKSSDNTLNSLTIDNKSVSLDNLKYSVGYNTSTITIIPKTNNSKATVSGDVGQKQLSVGLNTFNIIVTAENGSKRIYTLEVTRAKQIDNTDCELILKSSVYKIDNKALTVGGVSTSHSIETIKKNLSSDCGTISVTNDKVLLSHNSDIKEYKILRAWISQTGQQVIKYTAIIIAIVLLIGLLLFIRIKLLKNKK